MPKDRNGALSKLRDFFRLLEGLFTFDLEEYFRTHLEVRYLVHLCLTWVLEKKEVTLEEIIRHTPNEFRPGGKYSSEEEISKLAIALQLVARQFNFSIIQEDVVSKVKKEVRTPRISGRKKSSAKAKEELVLEGLPGEFVNHVGGVEKAKEIIKSAYKEAGSHGEAAKILSEKFGKDMPTYTLIYMIKRLKLKVKPGKRGKVRKGKPAKKKKSKGKFSGRLGKFAELVGGPKEAKKIVQRIYNQNEKSQKKAAKALSDEYQDFFKENPINQRMFSGWMDDLKCKARPRAGGRPSGKGKKPEFKGKVGEFVKLAGGISEAKKNIRAAFKKAKSQAEAAEILSKVFFKKPLPPYALSYMVKRLKLKVKPGKRIQPRKAKLAKKKKSKFRGLLGKFIGHVGGIPVAKRIIRKALKNTRTLAEAAKSLSDGYPEVFKEPPSVYTILRMKNKLKIKEKPGKPKADRGKGEIEITPGLRKKMDDFGYPTIEDLLEHLHVKENMSPRVLGEYFSIPAGKIKKALGDRGVLKKIIGRQPLVKENLKNLAVLQEKARGSKGSHEEKEDNKGEPRKKINNRIDIDQSGFSGKEQQRLLRLLEQFSCDSFSQLFTVIEGEPRTASRAAAKLKMTVPEYIDFKRSLGHC